MPDDPDQIASDQDLKDPTADKSWLEMENLRGDEVLGVEESPLAGLDE